MKSRQRSVKLYFQQRKNQTSNTTDKAKTQVRPGDLANPADNQSAEWPEDLAFLKDYCSDVSVADAIQTHVFSVTKEAQFHDSVITILGSLVTGETRRLSQKQVN